MHAHVARAGGAVRRRVGCLVNVWLIWDAILHWSYFRIHLYQLGTIYFCYYDCHSPEIRARRDQILQNNFTMDLFTQRSPNLQSVSLPVRMFARVSHSTLPVSYQTAAFSLVKETSFFRDVDHKCRIFKVWPCWGLVRFID